jgi:outer membrane protein
MTPAPKRRFLPFAPLAAAFALALVPAWAQAQSLRELYDAARAYDATYLAARALHDSAQYRVGQAEAANKPNVGLTANAQRTDADVPNTVSGGVTIPNTAGHRYSNRVDAGVNATQSLYNRSNGVVIEQARRAYEVAQADLETAEQDLIVRVAQAYFDVLAAQDTLGTAQAGKKAISEQLASAKRNFEVGTATITDTREAQARFDLSTATEIAADNDLLTKRIALDQLVGRPNVDPRPLAVPVTLPGVAPANVEEWVAPSQAQHPAVQRALLALDVARLETEKARAGHLPTLDAVGTVGVTRTTGSLNTAQGSGGSASLGVQLNLPLFSGFSVQNRIKETIVLEDKSRNDLEAARRAVAQATRVAFFGVQSGQAQAKALEAAEASSKLALEATQLGYRVGVRVNLDVLNAQTQLFNTQRDLSKARYDVLLATLRLRQASGSLAATDVSALAALLAP